MRAVLLLLSLSLATLPAAAQGGANLIWSDEFDYTGLPDPAKWDYEVGGHGWGNKELQYYTRARPENARVAGGRLILTARREEFEGRQYTSARLVTKGRREFTYGWFEVRAKLPRGRGTWPAIWMLGADRRTTNWPEVGEIDIMEHVGFDPGRIHAAIHCQAYNHMAGTQKSATTAAPDAMDEFHVYALDWTRDAIEIYLDGKRYFRFDNEKTGRDTWPFDRPFYLLLNIAVGGNWGGRQGVDESVFPQSMTVDYVRVYDRKP